MLFVLYLTATKIAIFVFLPTATCAFHLMGLLHFIRRNTYHHVFFDLDRTLWDFERNRDLTLGQMYVEHRLERVFGSLQTFSECYCRHNDRLWGYYGRHEIDKPTLRFKRFYDTLREFGLDDPTLTHTLDADYIGLMPSHNALVDGAAELLCYLSERNYQLHIITNGFSEVQSPKLERAGVLQHFQWVITSEQSGVHKPDPRAFGYALAGYGRTLFGQPAKMDYILLGLLLFIIPKENFTLKRRWLWIGLLALIIGFITCRLLGGSFRRRLFGRICRTC